MLFVLVTEIVTPVNCTCVHFLLQPYKFMSYCKHTHNSYSFLLLYYLLYMYTKNYDLYLLNWTIGTDYILAIIIGLNLKFKSHLCKDCHAYKQIYIIQERRKISDVIITSNNCK